MHSTSLPRSVQPFRAACIPHGTHRTSWVPRRAGRTAADHVDPGPSNTARQAGLAASPLPTCSEHRLRCTACVAAARADVPADQSADLYPDVQSPALTPRSEPPTSAIAISASAAVRTRATTSTSGSGSATAPGATVAGDLRLDLWMSLLQASAAQLVTAATGAAAAASDVAMHLQRLSQPPPLHFPPGPSGDQTLFLLSDPLGFLTSATSQYGPLVGLLLGGERVVLVTGREVARDVLVEQAGSVYVKEGTAFFPGSSLAGNGLLVSDGAVWQRQRRLSNPAFRRAAVEAYADAMMMATRDMLDREWGAGGTRDVYEDFNALTLRVTLEALFGFRTTQRQQRQQTAAAPSSTSASSSSSSTSSPPLSSSGNGSEEAQRIVAAVEKAFTFFTQRAATGFIIPEWLPTWDNLEFAAAVQQLDRVVYGMIARRRKELVEVHGSVAAAADAAAAAAAAARGGSVAATATTAAVRLDLLTSLLLSRDEDGSGMSDQALRDELMTLLVAGQETSAILLGWAVALLAAHPEVQARVAAEVAAVCGQGEAPTAASVRQMPYLESVVLETLRLYSPAYMVGRCTRVDTTLGPYILPAGTTVLVSPYIMQRDSAVWNQPGAFIPERWDELRNREGYQGYMSLMSNLGPNGAYLPFGGGPRNCIGTGFAMMEAMMVLAAVLQRYSLALQPPPLQQLQSSPARSVAAVAAGLPASFPKPKPLLTLRPESVVLRIRPRVQQHLLSW